MTKIQKLKKKLPYTANNQGKRKLKQDYKPQIRETGSIKNKKKQTVLSLI